MDRTVHANANDPWHRPGRGSNNGIEEGGAMPVYEFACLDCGREFTLVLSIHDYERRGFVCPHCKSKAVERLATTCGVITSKKS